MNIIFLDIDGVMINSIHVKKSEYHEGQEFSPVAVDCLKKIIQHTNARLVISSTWRLGETVDSLKQRVFRHYDLDDYIVGLTPVLGEVIRGDEIERYLRTTTHPIHNFVIIDDDYDMGAMINWLIRTNTRRGLTPYEADKAIHLLKFGLLAKTGLNETVRRYVEYEQGEV